MATKVWAAAASGNFSTDANWVGGVKPVAGDDIDIHQGGDGSQDLALVFGSYSQNAGYTGTVGVPYGTNWGTTGNWTQAAGTFSSSSTAIITVGGDFMQTGGMIEAFGLSIVMTGSNKVLSFAEDPYVNKLTINGTVTLPITSADMSLMGISDGGLTVGISGIFTMNRQVIFYALFGGTITNNGTIQGTGSLTWADDGGTVNFVPGIITCPVILTTFICTADVTFVLVGNVSLGSTLSVYSDSEIYYVTLDLTGNNYALSATNITNGGQSIINGRASRIICSSYTQNGANSLFTQGGYFRCTGATNISGGIWSISAVARVASLTHSNGLIVVASGYILYYDTTASLTGGFRSGVIDRWPFPSEKGDDAILFEPSVETYTQTRIAAAAAATGWLYPEYSLTENLVGAVCMAGSDVECSGSSGARLYHTTYSWELPTGTVIVGLLIRFKLYSDSAAHRYRLRASWDDGTNWTTVQQGNFPNTLQWVDYDALQGHANWTAAELALLRTQICSLDGNGSDWDFVDVIEAVVTYGKPKASEKGKDAVLFETPKAGARF